MIYPDRILGQSRKLETVDGCYRNDQVKHRTVSLDALQENSSVRVVKTWRRKGYTGGHGKFGHIYLEDCIETGEWRAVKDIEKSRNTMIDIDYKEEQRAMKFLEKHERLFVQIFGWFETDSDFHIVMECMLFGNFYKYMQEVWTESEVKAVARQLLEGLAALHQEGFVHRDLNPQNIFVVSKEPMRIKIGDFGLAKLAGSDPGVLVANGGARSRYFSGEMGIPIKGDSSESRFAVDLWAFGCITHELLTQAALFPTWQEWHSYVRGGEFPRNALCSKYISQEGIKFVESTLALLPENRITAKQALDSEWLRVFP